MTNASRLLAFVGRSPDEPGEPDDVLRHEDAVAEAGAAWPLVRIRSPWSRHRDVERVIVGSHPARADVLLCGRGIHPEHVRLYVPHDATGTVDLLAIVPGTTRVNGRPVEPREWCGLRGDETIDLGPWRFVYRTGPAG